MRVSGSESYALLFLLVKRKTLVCRNSVWIKPSTNQPSRRRMKGISHNAPVSDETKEKRHWEWDVRHSGTCRRENDKCSLLYQSFVYLRQSVDSRFPAIFRAPWIRDEPSRARDVAAAPLIYYRKGNYCNRIGKRAGYAALMSERTARQKKQPLCQNYRIIYCLKRIRN